MRIAICDDEIIFAEELKKKIESYYHSLDVVIEIYDRPTMLLSKLMDQNEPYQAIFLDIEMPMLDGMTLAKKIREKQKKVEIIFLSSHAEYIEDGYEVMAFRFLTKPVQMKKLERTLAALEKKSMADRKLELVENGIHYFVPQSEILCIKAENVYLKIYTEKREFLVRGKLQSMMEKLDPNVFFTVHRSYVISLGAVSSFQKNQLLLKNNRIVPVSRKNQSAFEDAMFDYIRKQS